MVNAGHALNGVDRASLNQEAENLFGLVHRSVHAVQDIVAGIGEYLAAL